MHIRCLAACLVGSCLVLSPVCAINWSSPQNLSQTGNKFDFGTGYAFDSQGNIHAVWQSWPYEGTIDLTYATNASGSWTTQRICGNVADYPALVIREQDQTLHVVYRGGTSGGGGRLYTRSKPLSGGSWSGATEWGEHDQSYFRWAAINDNGDIYALYLHLFDDSAQTRNGLYGKCLPYGGSWGSLEIAQGSGDDGNWAGNGHVVSHGTDFYVLYDLHNGGNYRIRHADGSWEDRVYMHSGSALRLAWSPVDSRHVAAAWFSHDGGCDLDFNIHVAFSTDGMATWGDDAAISDSCWISRGQEICFDDNDNLHCVWQRKDSDPADWDVWYAGCFDDRWGANVNVSGQWSSGDNVTREALQYNDNTLHLFCSIDTNPDSKGDIQYMTSDINAMPPATVTRTPTPTHTPRPPTATATGTVTNTSRFNVGTFTPTQTSVPPTSTLTPTPGITPGAEALSIW